MYLLLFLLLLPVHFDSEDNDDADNNEQHDRNDDSLKYNPNETHDEMSLVAKQNLREFEKKTPGLEVGPIALASEKQRGSPKAPPGGIYSLRK